MRDATRRGSRSIQILCLLAVLVLAAATAGCGSAAVDSAATVGGTGAGGTGPPVGSATLSWDPPTSNVDGTPLLDLAGYEVYYGTQSGFYTDVVDVGNLTEVTIGGLSGDTYYFAVLAYTSSGLRSGLSAEVVKSTR